MRLYSIGVVVAALFVLSMCTDDRPVRVIDLSAYDFTYPHYIVFDRDENLIVCTFFGEVNAPTAVKISSASNETSLQVDDIVARDAAVDADNNIYILESRQQTIAKLSNNGTLIDRWPSPFDRSVTSLRGASVLEPFLFVFGTGGLVAKLNASNGDVVFTTTLQARFIYSVYTSVDGHIDLFTHDAVVRVDRDLKETTLVNSSDTAPFGYEGFVCEDQFGHLFVSSYASAISNQLYIFDVATGSLLYRMNSSAIRVVAGVAVRPSTNELYVADFRGNVILVFNNTAVLPTTPSSSSGSNHFSSSSSLVESSLIAASSSLSVTSLTSSTPTSTSLLLSSSSSSSSPSPPNTDESTDSFALTIIIVIIVSVSCITALVMVAYLCRRRFFNRNAFEPNSDFKVELLGERLDNLSV